LCDRDGKDYDMSRQTVEVRARDVKMAAVVRDVLRDNLDTIAFDARQN
jgi:hypothetical protein